MDIQIRHTHKITNWHVAIIVLITLGVHSISLPTLAADKFQQPDILVLGDSQITFGSGPAYLRFFKNLSSYCNPDQKQSEYLEKLGHSTVGVIGVRSSTLSSWTARTNKNKAKVCGVDPKWNINAGAYGIINRTRKEYVQIGRGTQFQFCKKNTSPFEAVFQKENYAPKLLVLSFMGNSAKDWSAHPNIALRDVQKTFRQLPDDLPCIYLTTAPSYTQKSVDIRVKAQENLKKAFVKGDGKCSFVEGISTKTIAANLGNKRHFRRKKSGAVKDPYHPNKRGARKFFSLTKHSICTAVFEQLAKHTK